MLVGLVKITSHLDSQTEFQIFFIRHVGGAQNSSNMAAP